MTNDVSDEILSAFIDGQLDGAQRDELERRLAADPQLRTRLEELSKVDGLLREAFDPPDFAETPERFRALVERESAPSDKVRLFRPRARGLDWRMPIAASLALALSGAGGYWAGRGSVSGANLVAEAGSIQIGASTPLFALLEATPSATQRDAGALGVFKPSIAYQAADGRFCREFELAEEANRLAGIACRNDESWRVEVLVAGATAQDGYAPVSDDNAALDGTLDRLGVGAPLTGEQEATAMSQGWVARR